MRNFPGIHQQRCGRDGQPIAVSNFAKRAPPLSRLSVSPSDSALFEIQLGDELLSSSSTAVDIPSTPLAGDSFDDKSPSFVVLKFGGTSVAKHLPSIVDTILRTRRSQYGPKKHMPILVCSAQSYTFKSEGTTQRLLAAIEAALLPTFTAPPTLSPPANNDSPVTPPATPPLTPPCGDSPSTPVATPLPPSNVEEAQRDRQAENTNSPVSPKDILDGIFERHCAGARIYVTDEKVRVVLEEELRRDCERVVSILTAVETIGDITPRTRDTVVSVGELMACRTVVAALVSRNIPARLVNLNDLYLSPSHKSFNADALCTAIKARVFEVSRTRKDDEATPVLVATGFFGPLPGVSLLDHIGRGYTDVCAALCARAIGAAELQIWKEVDGVFSADPRKIPTARLLPELSANPLTGPIFQDAKLLTSYGSEVVHHRAIDQATHARIPILVKNVVNPAAGGTRIVTSPPLTPPATPPTSTPPRTPTPSPPGTPSSEESSPKPNLNPVTPFAITVLDDLDLFKLRFPSHSWDASLGHPLTFVLDRLGKDQASHLDLISASAHGVVSFVLPSAASPVRQQTDWEAQLWKLGIEVEVSRRMSYLQIVCVSSPRVSSAIVGAFASADIDMALLSYAHGIGILLEKRVARRAAAVVHDALLEGGW
ncbi:hypothetical protein DXG03_008314 [Asterophora parasitica]|uniref:Aspartate/glutamate/uridylate kinase domain-containing protein n=1 Tax=Asterophora parasitica TaxID=117018 RepID=A0A9P7GCG0_9AGAR|nr:hypothetical protein DXG03_008314 [Asterophora parasitica]